MSQHARPVRSTQPETSGQLTLRRPAEVDWHLPAFGSQPAVILLGPGSCDGGSDPELRRLRCGPTRRSCGASICDQWRSANSSSSTPIGHTETSVLPKDPSRRFAITNSRTGPDDPGSDESAVFWWRPRDENTRHTRISGSYRRTNSGGPWATFTEHPGFPSGSESDPFESYSLLPYLCGVSESAHYTLLNPGQFFGPRSMMASPNQAPARLYATARACLRGQFLPDVSETNQVFVDKFRVEFEGQAHWADWQGWSLDPKGQTGSTAAFKGSSPVDPVVFHTEGARITIHRGSSYAAVGGISASLDSTCWFVLELDAPMHVLVAFERFVRPLRELLIMCRGAGVSFRAISVSEKGWESEFTDSPIHPWLELDVDNGTSGFQEGSQVSFLDFALVLDDFEPKHLSRHIQLAHQHQFALAQYLAIRVGEAGNRLVRLITAVQSLESLYRGIYPSFRPPGANRWSKRARDLLKEAGAPPDYVAAAGRGIQQSHFGRLADKLQVLDADTGGNISRLCNDAPWAMAVEQIRNVIAHGLPSPIDPISNRRGVIVAQEICLLLFELSWLNLMGLEAGAAFAAISEKSQFWIRRNRVEGDFATLLNYLNS